MDGGQTTRSTHGNGGMNDGDVLRNHMRSKVGKQGSAPTPPRLPD